MDRTKIVSPDISPLREVMTSRLQSPIRQSIEFESPIITIPGSVRGNKVQSKQNTQDPLTKSETTEAFCLFFLIRERAAAIMVSQMRKISGQKWPGGFAAGGKQHSCVRVALNLHAKRGADTGK